MQHAALVRVLQCVKQRQRQGLQVIPGQPLRLGGHDLVQRWSCQQLQGQKRALAMRIYVETVRAHDMAVVQAAGQSKLAVEQGVGVGVAGEGVVQCFQRNPGFRVAKLFAHQITCPINRAHTADAKQAFDAIPLAHQLW